MLSILFYKGAQLLTVSYFRSKSKKHKHYTKKKSSKKEKHHKHILADVDRSRWSRVIHSSQSQPVPNTSVLSDRTRPISTSSSDSPVIAYVSRCNESTAMTSSAAHSSYAHTVCLDPRKPVSTSSATVTCQPTSAVSTATSDVSAAKRGMTSSRSLSPLIDVTSTETTRDDDTMDESRSQLPVDEATDPNQSAANDEWFIDYSKNSYQHREDKGNKSKLNIRKQIRYFVKNNIAEKYKTKHCKKHDRGHKNQKN